MGIFSIFILINIHKSNIDLPKVKIKSCYDGDTCKTFTGERIRIACIDAPELKGERSNPIAAIKSRDYLNSFIGGKEVNLRRITKDRYGRTVAELYKDGVNIQKDLLEKGYANIHKKYVSQCPSLNNK